MDPTPESSVDVEPELSPEDEAVFDRFEDCLADAEGSLDGDLGEEGELSPEQEGSVEERVGGD